MTQPEPPIVLDLDPTGYVAGMNQSAQVTDQFTGSLRSSTAALAAVPLVMRQAGAHIPVAGFTALAMVAGRTQQQLSPLRATTKVLGSDFDVLNKGMNRLAREMPIGNAGAREMVTTLTKLGIASKGQERNVTDLAKVYTKLGGATGEGPIALAEGMTQLARVTNTGFNTKRIESLADSLTTVSAQTGASATGILGFSRLIAPMASASGVGATKIMGISAAFSKLGEDGAMGANAFNKMMGDLNKSVRDGSPMLANYASIVGKTQSQFAALAKSDPTEAITQVTEAIAKAGSAGPRMLEQLNLEGPRTMRVFQGLSASGGLRQSVAASVGAYGQGSTEKGSQEAYRGLIDSMERFGTTLHQVTESLGGPFLGMLTRTVNVAGVGVGGVRRVADSAPVQDMLKALATVGIPALMALRFLGGGVRAAFAGQLATSGPVRGFFGGMAQGQAAATGGAAESTFAARRLGGQAYNDAAAQGEYGRGRMIAVNQGFERAGARLGSFLSSGAPAGGPGMFTTLRGAGVAATAAYMRMNEEAARMARLPHTQREFAGTPRGAAFDQFKTNSDYNRYLRETQAITSQQYAQNQLANVRALSGQVGQEGMGANARTLARGFGGMASRTLAAGAGAAVNLGGNLMSGLGGPVGIGLTGAMIGMQIKGMSNAAEAKNAASAANASNMLDSYRVALGKATVATSTFAGALEASSKAQLQVGKRATIEEISTAAAQGGKKSRQEDYTGMTVAQVVRRANVSGRLTGLGRDEQQRIAQDMLLSGFSRTQAMDAMSQMDTLEGPDLGGATDLGGLASSSADVSRGNYKRYARGKNLQYLAPGGVGMVPGLLRRVPGVSRVPGLGKLTGDNFLTADTLSDRQGKEADQFAAEVGQRYGTRAGMYEGKFAAGQRAKEMDQLVQEALDAGNKDYAERLEKDFSEQFGFSRKSMSSNRIKAAGGYVEALAADNKDFRQGAYQDIKGAPTTGVVKQGYANTTLTEAGNPLARFFDVKSGDAVAKAVQAMVGPGGKPEDPATQLTALNSIMAAAKASGMSLEAVNVAAAHAANSMGDLTDANSQLIRMLRTQTGLAVAEQRSQMSSTGAAKSRIREAVAIAGQAPVGTEGIQTRVEQQQVIEGERENAINAAQARVAQAREIQVQIGRQAQDFGLQMKYVQDDYTRTLSRNWLAYNISVDRTTEQYELGRTRTIEDAGRARVYALRDQAKQLRRIAEDGAKGIYDAYQRIQAQPVWDASNLFGNMAEENQAIAQQINNLGKFRQQGGSSQLIKLLGLNDPKNAQQLSSLIDDIARDPKVLDSMNKAASARNQLGGKLTLDVDNTGVQRQVEDFGENLKRTDKALSISLARGEHDLHVTLGHMESDHQITLLQMAEDRQTMVNRATLANKTSLKRMTEDIHRSDQEITRDLTTLTKDLQDILAGQVVDFDHQVSSTLQGSLDILKAFNAKGEFKDELDKLATAGLAAQVITMDPAQLATGQKGQPKGAKAVSPLDVLKGATGDGPGTAGGIGMGYRAQESVIEKAFPGIHAAGDPGRTGKTVSGNVSFHSQGRAVDISPPSMKVFNWIAEHYPNSRELIYTPAGRAQLKDGQPHVYSADVAKGHYDHVHWAMALGGIATKPTKALVAEAGYNEAVIPLNSHGVGALADAMKRYVSHDDARVLQASHGVSYVTYDYSSQSIDNRVVIEKAEVHGIDMDDAIHQLRENQRDANLVAVQARRR